MTITFPPSGRFTSSVKAQILAAILNGEMSEDEAQREYKVSPEEMAEWWRRYRAGGYRGLRVTRDWRERNKVRR